MADKMQDAAGENESPAAPAADTDALPSAGDLGLSTAGPDDQQDAPRELAQLTPGDKPAQRGKGRPRKYRTAAERERAAKDRRNAKLKQQRAADRALRAAEAALGVKSPAAAPGAAAPAAAPNVGDLTAAEREVTAAEQPAVQMPEGQLAVMLGLGCDITARMIPAKYGGGALSEEERELLGGVWASALAPYLSGTASVMGLAIISTVQIFALRAMKQQGEAEPEPANTRNGAAVKPADAPPSDKPAADKAPSAPAARPATIKPARLRSVPAVIHD